MNNIHVSADEERWVGWKKVDANHRRLSGERDMSATNGKMNRNLLERSKRESKIF